jgi:hypothetical protein
MVVPRGTSGQPTFVTGAAARAVGHLLRAESDAILVGAGTVRDDDALHARRDHGLAAGRRAAVMRARLERHEHRAAEGTLPRREERGDLGVRATRSLVEAFAGEGSGRVEDHAADAGIRGRRVAAALGERERALHGSAGGALSHR